MKKFKLRLVSTEKLPANHCFLLFRSMSFADSCICYIQNMVYKWYMNMFDISDTDVLSNDIYWISNLICMQ